MVCWCYQLPKISHIIQCYLDKPNLKSLEIQLHGPIPQHRTQREGRKHRPCDNSFHSLSGLTSPHSSNSQRRRALRVISNPHTHPPSTGDTNHCSTKKPQTNPKPSKKKNKKTQTHHYHKKAAFFFLLLLLHPNSPRTWHMGNSLNSCS